MTHQNAMWSFRAISTTRSLLATQDRKAETRGCNTKEKGLRQHRGFSEGLCVWAQSLDVSSLQKAPRHLLAFTQGEVKDM